MFLKYDIIRGEKVLSEDEIQTVIEGLNFDQRQILLDWASKTISYEEAFGEQVEETREGQLALGLLTIIMIDPNGSTRATNPETYGVGPELSFRVRREIRS